MWVITTVLVIVLQYNVIGKTGSMITTLIGNTIGNIDLHILKTKYNCKYNHLNEWLYNS